MFTWKTDAIIALIALLFCALIWVLANCPPLP